MDWILAIFWFSGAWLAYTYMGYPLVLMLLARLRRVHPQVNEQYLPTVSVLISARNEERDIGWKVSETLNWNYPPDKLEVMVASDASDDKTDQVLSGIGDPRLTFVRMEQRGGKGRALNRLAQLAKGDVLFFTDANAHIPANAIRGMVRHLADPRVGSVTGRTSSVREAGDHAVGTGSRTYMGYEALVNDLENSLGSVLACDGAIFCMRRSLYRPVSPDLANDLELPIRVRYAGLWTRFEPQACVIEKETESPRQEFARRRRIAAQGLLAFWRLRRVLGFCGACQLASHKLLRYATLVPLSLLVGSAAKLADISFFKVVFVLLLAFLALALLGLMAALRRKPVGFLLSVPFYMVFGSLGSLVGMIDACRGRRFDVWEIATLSRGQAIPE